MTGLDLDYPAGASVLVACSGGSDSLALLHLLKDDGRWPLQVAHLDHAGRPDSHQQARQLSQLCRQLALPFHTRRLHVEKWARRYGLSWEAAGRELRYLWLKKLAEKLDALLVTAHTADDQAETVVMRLISGSTLVGLAGIYPQGLRLARPLLHWRRQQLRAELERRGLSWFEDPSNQDPRFLRVRLRNHLMPLLEELNAGAVEHLTQLAEDALLLRPLLQRTTPLLQMNRLEFEEFIHGLWLALNPPPGSRWNRRHAQSIFAALPQKTWRSWNLPGNTWAEWDGRRLALGRPVDLPLLTPPGLEWRTRLPGDHWQGRSLKRILNDWRVPRRARDSLPLLVRPPHEVLAVLGFRNQPEVASWTLQERSGLLIVEAAAPDEHATH